MIIVTGTAAAWCVVSAGHREERPQKAIWISRYEDIRTNKPLSEQGELKCSRMCQPELVRSLPINIPSLPNKGRSVRALIENHRQQRERVLIKLKRVEIRAVMD